MCDRVGQPVTSLVRRASGPGPDGAGTLAFMFFRPAVGEGGRSRVARLAWILCGEADRRADPLCPPLRAASTRGDEPLAGIRPPPHRADLKPTVKVRCRTGVEEWRPLTAVSVARDVYYMCQGIDRRMFIDRVLPDEKVGRPDGSCPPLCLTVVE